MQTITQRVTSDCIDEFVFQVADDTPDFIIAPFVDWLTNYLNDGASFQDGQTLQYGFAQLCCSVKSRTLRLKSPDFRSFPVEWNEDLSPVFGMSAAHQYVPESLGIAPNIPSMLQTAIVGKYFDGQPMFANRLEPVESNPNDSGWFFGSMREDVDNNSPDELQLLSLYEVITRIPHMQDFVSLPMNYQVVFTNNTLHVLQDLEEVEVPKDSYLDQRLDRWNQ